MKKILRCPTCEERGIKQNLAEVLPSGIVSIMRRRSKEKNVDSTLIAGKDFSVLCGLCGSIVYRKKQDLWQIPTPSPEPADL